jgi:hypothetical protein
VRNGRHANTGYPHYRSVYVNGSSLAVVGDVQADTTSAAHMPKWQQKPATHTLWRSMLRPQQTGQGRARQVYAKLPTTIGQLTTQTLWGQWHKGVRTWGSGGGHEDLCASKNTCNARLLCQCAKPPGPCKSARYCRARHMLPQQRVSRAHLKLVGCLGALNRLLQQSLIFRPHLVHTGYQHWISTALTPQYSECLPSPSCKTCMHAIGVSPTPIRTTTCATIITIQIATANSLQP